MHCEPTWATREKKNYPETAESGQFWRSTLIDSDSRLRVARGIAKDETQASIEVSQTLQRRGHPEGPPPIISDGWGGIDDAMVEVYGLVPEYGGRGRPPTRKQPQPGWQYLQMVKIRDERGKFQGTKLRSVFGSRMEVLELLGKSTAYIERSQLTSRLLNGRQVRKTLAFSKSLDLYRASAVWEDAYYNLARPHKSLRQAMLCGRQKWQKTTPAMAAGLTDHIWTVKELLTVVPVPCVSNTCRGDYRSTRRPKSFRRITRNLPLSLKRKLGKFCACFRTIHAILRCKCTPYEAQKTPKYSRAIWIGTQVIVLRSTMKTIPSFSGELVLTK